MKKITIHFATLAAMTLVTTTHIYADDKAELAKKLANPVANLTSVPIQVNYNENFNQQETGEQWSTNIQPVIPISLNDDWMVISRTIIPIIDQTDIPIPGSNASGLGDIQQQTFFHPKN